MAGVFYAPIERTDDEGRASQHILAELAAARIPVVLFDRDTVAFPERSAYDLVALENHRGGYLLAQHLLRLGRRRICFVARPRSAPTVERRTAGYREAMWQAGQLVDPSWIRYGDPQNLDFVLPHTSATLLFWKDVSVMAVSKRLEHEKVHTTLEHHGHVLPSMPDRAVEVMEDAVTGYRPADVPGAVRLEANAVKDRRGWGVDPAVARSLGPDAVSPRPSPGWHLGRTPRIRASLR